MQSHEFRDLGQSRVYGRRMYAICGLHGCGKPRHAPVHRGLVPRHQGLRPEDRHPFLEGPVRLRCATCGKVRNSMRHRGAVAGLPILPRPQAPATPVPVIAEPPAREHPEPRIGQDPLLYLALGYCEALQVVESVPITVRFNARQLARSIRDVLRLDSTSPQDVAKPNGNGHSNGHAPRAQPVLQQAGTPAVRRAFRSGNVRHLFEIAVAAGWTWRRTGNGHVVIDAPGQKAHISLSTTMSDAGSGRSWGNLKAEAKRKGLAIE